MPVRLVLAHAAALQISLAAALTLPTLLVESPEAHAKSRTPRPRGVAYALKTRRGYRIRYQPFRYGRTHWVTRPSKPPTALRCTADGRNVVYAESGKVKVSPLKPGGRTRTLQSLPGAIWQLHRHRLRTFIQPSPTGRFVAVPDASGIAVHELRGGKGNEPLVIKPPTSGGDKAGKVRVIHPARWLPGQDALLYLTQRGETGSGAVDARVFDMVQGRHTLWFPVLRQPVDGVTAFDAVWNRSATRVALSLAVTRGKTAGVRFRVFSVNPFKRLKLPRRIRIGRIHGFDSRLGDVVFTGRLDRKPAKLYWYSFTRKRRRLLDIGYLSSGRLVVDFSPERRTALVAQPHRSGKCSGKHKLYKASVRNGMHSLVRWAAWTEIVATDPAGAWYIFRSGSTCRHRRPVLYLMMADGWGLLRDLPSRFASLRKVSPRQAALCPEPPRKSRRRRR